MEDVENVYRVRSIAGRHLVTTDHGSWLMLNDGELSMLRNGTYKDDKLLYSRLVDSGIIINGSNVAEVAGSLRKKYAFVSQGTSLHIIIVTLRCNNKCVYCHASSVPVSSNGFDMDKATAKATVDFIFQSPSPSIMIEFQGGEPMLNFDVVKYIIEYAKEVNRSANKSLEFTMVSNFSLMDAGKLSFLVDNNVSICTSLDGPAWLHDRNRPSCANTGSHGDVSRWVPNVKSSYREKNINNRTANALLTVTRSSLGHHKELVDEYVRLGLKKIFFRQMNNLGFAKAVADDTNYSAEEFVEFWKKSMDYIIWINLKGTRIEEYMASIIARKIILKQEPNYLEQRSPCGAVIGQMAYNYNGDIYTCDEGRMVGNDIFMLGNVKSSSYPDVVRSDKTCCMVSSSINDTQICDACAYKPFCGICPVCNYAEQGSIIGKITETKRCKIFMAQFDYMFDKITNYPAAKGVFESWLKPDPKING